MTNERSLYRPINCEFHDLLEALATLRKQVRISFRDYGGITQSRNCVITDVYARDGAEFLAINTGEILRLDQLLEVDGERLADYQQGPECRLD